MDFLVAQTSFKRHENQNKNQGATNKKNKK